jgi:hypothetical protein
VCSARRLSLDIPQLHHPIPGQPVLEFKGVAERGKETDTRFFFFRGHLHLPNGVCFFQIYMFSVIFLEPKHNS